MPWVKLARPGGRLSASPRGQPAGEGGAPQPKRYAGWRACARDTRHWSRTRRDSSLLVACTHVLGEKAIPQRGGPHAAARRSSANPPGLRGPPGRHQTRSGISLSREDGIGSVINNLARRTRVKLVRLRADRCGWPVCGEHLPGGEPLLPGGGRTWGERAKHRARPSGSRDAYR